MGASQAARKVYDTALASLAGRPASVGRHAALLALPFADMEAAGSGKDAAARALHVLTWLGAGGSYATFQTKADPGAPSHSDRCAAHPCMHAEKKDACPFYHVLTGASFSGSLKRLAA